MKKISVGIIGGTGGMGRWFADLLQKEGYPVLISSRKTAMSIADIAKRCQVVVVSVPISATARIIKQVGPMLTEDQLLMDLTSLKKEPVDLMLACSKADVIGCHPLFGPALADASGQNVVLCPARGNHWLPWLNNIWKKNGLVVLERTPEEHDALMAIVQALNHLNTISLGLAIAETGIELTEINKFSTPIFQTKIGIVKKIFTESPELYADIITGNPDTEKMLDIYEKALVTLRQAVKEGKGSDLKSVIANTAKKLFPPVS
jgi:prephenate dehydrogenase